MRKYSYHPYALTTIFFWSLAFVFTRLTLPYVSASSLGFLRYLAASCTLAVVAIATKMKFPRIVDVPWFLLSGFFGFFLYMLLFNRGLSTVTASMASVVNATVPVITALLASVVYHEKLKGFQRLAILVELIGIVVLILMNGGLTEGIGLLWLFLAAIALSIYNVLQRKLTKTYTALQSSTYSIFGGTFLLAIFAPAAFREISKAPASQYFYIAVLGVFSSALAFVTWSKAFAKAENTAQVSNYMVLTLFMTSLLGFFIAKETPSAATLCGGGITFIGVLIFNFSTDLSRLAAELKRRGEDKT